MAFQSFKIFKLMAEKSTEKKIKLFLNDNAKVYLSGAFTVFCQTEGIDHITIA